MDKEWILCAAILFDNGKEYIHQPINVQTGFVVCGQRHHNCLATVWILNGEKKIDYEKEVQGFLTSSNRFVNREEASIIANKANQVDRQPKRLFSEDLY